MSERERERELDLIEVDEDVEPDLHVHCLPRGVCLSFEEKGGSEAGARADRGRALTLLGWGAADLQARGRAEWRVVTISTRTTIKLDRSVRRLAVAGAASASRCSRVES